MAITAHLMELLEQCGENETDETPSLLRGYFDERKAFHYDDEYMPYSETVFPDEYLLAYPEICELARLKGVDIPESPEIDEATLY